VIGDDGRPILDTQGADSNSCSVWRDALRKIDEEFIVWSRTFKRMHGTGEAFCSGRDGGGQEDSAQDEQDGVDSQAAWESTEEEVNEVGNSGPAQNSSGPELVPE
jgi:hypothetical protein